jgi:hypothetical protein
MPLAFLICIIGFGVSQCAAWLVYGIRIPRFVESHGRRTAGMTAYLLLGWGWLMDYRTAHALRRQLRHTPWFLRLFEVFEVLAVVFFVAGILTAVFGA